MTSIDAASQVDECWSQLPTATQFPAQIFKLDSGLTVIHQQVPATPVVVVDVWVQAGATIEPENWGGMAHFLEHMIFKGTTKLAPGTFDWTIENQGGVTNAATSHDYAHYFIMTAAQTLESTLPPLAELLINAAIPDAEFGREREVVLEEIRQAWDDPDWQAYQTLVETAYENHPYGRPVLGTQAQLMARSPLEMRQFHRAYYQPENMTVVIVGGVEQQRALDLVHCHFSRFPGQLTRSESLVNGCYPTNSRSPTRRQVKPAIPAARRRVLDLPNLEQARLLMAWIGPGAEQLESAYGLELISILLAGGRTSRLVRDLREQQGLVQGVYSRFLLQRGSGLLTICAWLDPQHLESVEALICDQLTALRTTPISEPELARCQRLLSNDFAFSTEAPSQLAGLYGYYSTIAQADVAVTYPEMIQKFTAEDLRRLACQYLAPDRYAVTVLKPG